MIDPSNILKNLKLDVWYKALFYISGIILMIALFADVKGISNGQLQLLSSGGLLLGLGEWKNHKVASWIKPANIYTGSAALINAPIRQPDAFGILLDAIGIILMLIGVVCISIGVFKQSI